MGATLGWIKSPAVNQNKSYKGCRSYVEVTAPKGSIETHSPDSFAAVTSHQLSRFAWCYKMKFLKGITTSKGLTETVLDAFTMVTPLSWKESSGGSLTKSSHNAWIRWRPPEQNLRLGLTRKNLKGLHDFKEVKHRNIISVISISNL